MKAMTNIITPYDAMWREIGCLYRGLEIERAELERMVEGVAPEALHASRVKSGPTIGALLLGCASEEARWIHGRWRREEPPAGWKPFLDGGAGHGLDAILGWMRDVREATRLRLMKATDADLDRKTIPADGAPATLRWVLHGLLARAAYARGQIALLRLLGT
jgi:hypothetical protein